MLHSLKIWLTSVAPLYRTSLSCWLGGRDLAGPLLWWSSAGILSGDQPALHLASDEKLSDSGVGGSDLDLKPSRVPMAP